MGKRTKPFICTAIRSAVGLGNIVKLRSLDVISCIAVAGLYTVVDSVIVLIFLLADRKSDDYEEAKGGGGGGG